MAYVYWSTWYARVVLTNQMHALIHCPTVMRCLSVGRPRRFESWLRRLTTWAVALRQDSTES
jgi:hypothetical protein